MTEVETILIGLILGDGSLTPLSNRQHQLQLHLGYSERYFSYLKWIHQKLQPLGLNGIQPKRGYHQFHFYSKPSSLIGRLRTFFYPAGVKMVPKEIGQLLTEPISLAIWYMDDGTLDYRAKYHANACIATYNFSFHDCLQLRKVLIRNFGLQTTVSKSMMRGKIYYRLYFPSASMVKFMALIAPYMNHVLLTKS